MRGALVLVLCIAVLCVAQGSTAAWAPRYVSQVPRYVSESSGGQDCGCLPVVRPVCKGPLTWPNDCMARCSGVVAVPC